MCSLRLDFQKSLLSNELDRSESQILILFSHNYEKTYFLNKVCCKSDSPIVDYYYDGKRDSISR